MNPKELARLALGNNCPVSIDVAKLSRESLFELAELAVHRSITITFSNATMMGAADFTALTVLGQKGFIAFEL